MPIISRPSREPFVTFGEPDLVRAAAAAERFVTAVTNDPIGRGYHLTYLGASGNGKTMLAKSILERLGWDQWGWLAVIPEWLSGKAIEHAEGLFRDWRKVGDRLKNGDWEMIERLETVFLLVLDDVGAEYDPSKMLAAKLDRVLRARAGKWTVITANMQLPQVADQLDTRIASWIIRDENRVVTINAPDFALRKAAH